MKKRAISVGFVALGCPKNIVDSERMLAIIGEEGFCISSDPDNADVVVINTCGFIEPAKQEAIAAIKQAVKRKKNGAVGKVIVAGCLSEKMGEGLFDEVKGIDAIVGLGARESIGSIIKKTLEGDKHIYLPEHANTINDDRGRLLITPAHWAYLRISEGCNRKCAFCTIPAIRGQFRSKPMEMVVAEAKELVANGAIELSIIAQDSNYYGKDLKIENGLGKLIKELEKIKKLKWIRLMYLYPAGIDEVLLQAIVKSEKVVRYFDLPMQHVNNEILKKMRRADTKQKNQRLVERIRELMPEAVLRTTFITGFPGETDEQFDELLEFVKWAKFDAMGCFTFYAEKGTIAAEMDGQVEEKLKTQRADELMTIQQKIAFDRNAARVGSEMICLIDNVDQQGQGEGRFYGQAPHIDSVCVIKECKASAGSFIKTKVVGWEGYDLLVEQI